MGRVEERAKLVCSDRGDRLGDLSFATLCFFVYEIRRDCFRERAAARASSSKFRMTNVINYLATKPMYYISSSSKQMFGRRNYLMKFNEKKNDLLVSKRGFINSTEIFLIVQ